MPAAFRRGRHGPTARFSAGEADVMRDLFGQLVTMLEDSGPETSAEDGADPLEALTGMTDQSGDAAQAPSDPVLARLFPDGYRDDPDRAAEFRRFTEDDLRTGKLAAARAALATLDAPDQRQRVAVALDEDSGQAWLRALNDLRLTLGTRLEVSDETVDEMDELVNADPNDPRTVALSLYLWLGYLQESLVAAIEAGR
jgi:hypothetical protein